MKSEEVAVDQNANGDDSPCGRPARHFQIELFPSLDYVTSDRCVHKAGKQRHSGELQIGGLGISPRSLIDFKQFEPKTDEVEERNSFRFVDRFKAIANHGRLDEDARHEQHVVARQTGDPDDLTQE